MNFDDAHAYCRSNGLNLVKWDTLEKMQDVGFITGN